MESRLNKLFSKGYVFTTERLRSVEQIKLQYYDFSRWHFIMVGHLQDCLKVINTSPNSAFLTHGFNGQARNLHFNKIEWRDFWKAIS
jgi:hypothetical protein